MDLFRVDDPSLESQWRSIILFGSNSATYKFAFAQALLELASAEKTHVTLAELADPFSRNIIRHLKTSDKQGTAPSSKFLDYCRDYLGKRISHAELIEKTVRFGFVNVIEAFHNVKGEATIDPFYEDWKKAGEKGIVITDNLLKLKESSHFDSFGYEVEARWNLVESAWSLNLTPAALAVGVDESQGFLYIEDKHRRRKDLTSVRHALNGYQKGKCFYSFQDLRLEEGAGICHVDHFFPHVNQALHNANLDGVWNLVLADPHTNLEKSNRIPTPAYLERLYTRNEFYIGSKHPLGKAIEQQTGTTQRRRRAFLQKQLELASYGTRPTWRPSVELAKAF